MIKKNYDKILEGNRNNAFINERTPSTAKPRILNGINMIQTRGYKNKITNANGQQMMSRINQSKNFILLNFSLFLDTQVHGLWFDSLEDKKSCCNYFELAQYLANH